MAHSFVYIMTNKHNTVLYTGVTTDLARRLVAHRNGMGSAFTKKYHVTKLVFYEIFDDVRLAIAREKAIKGGSRARKEALIEGVNPTWSDLAEEVLGCFEGVASCAARCARVLLAMTAHHEWWGTEKGATRADFGLHASRSRD